MNTKRFRATNDLFTNVSSLSMQFLRKYEKFQRLQNRFMIIHIFGVQLPVYTIKVSVSIVCVCFYY